MSKTGLACPCGKSSDAFAIQDNGWGRCFGQCGGKNFPPEAVEEMKITKEVTDRPKVNFPLSPVPEVFRPFKQRGFTEAATQRYKLTVAKEGDVITNPESGRSAPYEAKYPLYDTSGNHIGNKVRMPNKRFLIEGTSHGAGLFGRHSFPAGSARYITVTEGQDDAVAVFQMSGCRYPAVSVHGASSALADIKADFEYLNSFENIILAFDNDDAGIKAAKQVANLPFPLGKLKILTFNKFNDANEYLLKGAGEQFTKEWWNAPVHKPDGLKLGSDMWEEILNRKEHFTVPYPWEGMNKLTYGVRTSEMIVVTAPTGVGKTSVLKHIEHLFLSHPEIKENNYGVGFLHLEEPNGDTALGLLSIHNSTPYHLPDVERPEEDIRKAFDELLNNDRVVIWDHFGSNSVDAVLDKVRHMVAMGCKYIVLDHLSIIVSDQSGGDERKQLDEITTKLKTLTMELDISVIAVVHTNRQGQIRGTAGVEQLANIIIRLDRDKTEKDEWRRNITTVTVEKNRFCGYTGVAGYLWYNKDTARLTELDEEEAAHFETGGTLREDEQW